MMAIQPTHTLRAETGLSRGLTLLLSAGAGLSAASLYYSQPMLAVIGGEFQASARVVGGIPMLTQLGYALGILLLAPLGDRFDRRRLLLVKSALLAAALLLSAAAPGIGWLLAASLVVGLTATLAQDFVPAAAALAAELHRGKVVGTVMTGLLLGILLSRLVSGFVAEAASWRVMFVLASAGVLLIAGAVWRWVPSFAPTTKLSYGALLRSMLDLWGKHGALRRAALAQALLSVAFSAFWSTLALVLSSRFHLGSTAAGAFGLAGAAGALAAPLAGRLADRRGPSLVTRVGAALAALFFGSLALGPALPGSWQLPLLVVGAIGFDFGIQASLIAHQTIVYGLEPPARSRLNALLVTGMFVGMATGSLLGSLLLARQGWPGVVALATAACVGALLVRLAPGRAS